MCARQRVCEMNMESPSKPKPESCGGVTAIVSCFCFLIVAVVKAVIVLGLKALFLLFDLLYSQRHASHSCET